MMGKDNFQVLRKQLMEKLDVFRELSDEEILETIDELILHIGREACISLKEKVELRQELFYSVRKLDVQNPTSKTAICMEKLILQSSV